MSELKPCPFCGGDVEMHVDGLPENGEAQPQFAQCEQCGALGPIDDDYDFAAHLWNTRPDSLTLTAAVQGEREVICSKLCELRTEVDCRIDHGANHGGHLDYVRDALDRILKGIDVCSECDGERWHKYENPLTGEITNRTPCSTCNGDEEVPGPAPAVDVLAVVREYVEAYDDYQETINFKKTCRNDESVTVAADRRIKAGLALRALVDGKGEAKENER